MSSTSVEAASSQAEPYGLPQQQQQSMMYGTGGGSGPPVAENTPTLNHLLQSGPEPRNKVISVPPGGVGGDSFVTPSPSSSSSSLPMPSSSAYTRDGYPPPPFSSSTPSHMPNSMKGGGSSETYDPNVPSSQSMGYSPMTPSSGAGMHHHQQQQQHHPHYPGWNSHPRANMGHQYPYPPQGPGPGAVANIYANQVKTTARHVPPSFCITIFLLIIYMRCVDFFMMI